MPVFSSPNSWLRVKGQVPHTQGLDAKTPSCPWSFPPQISGHPHSLCFFPLHDSPLDIGFPCSLLYFSA